MLTGRHKAETKKERIKHISTRWEMSDRGGEARCRFVCREFRKGDPRQDLFAVASSSFTSRVMSFVGERREGGVKFTFDVSNAFLHVPVEEPVTCDPPAEWLEEWIAGGGYPDVVWELKVELYGKRVAPKSWTTWFANLLTKEMKLQQCIEAPWFFRGGGRKNLQLEMHMGDGHGCAERRQDAEDFRDELAKHVFAE